MLHISIHAPLAGCDRYGGVTGLQRLISIHAPLAGCDLGLLILGCRINHFNPRTPCGVRRDTSEGYMLIDLISIHAPLAGCDVSALRFPVSRRHFNPRTPCGVRRCSKSDLSDQNKYFNPRTPCGVRPDASAAGTSGTISIHAPLAGCDWDAEADRQRVEISIHAPLAGCDYWEQPLFILLFISIHAPLAGCDCTCKRWRSNLRRFQSTHPLRGATRPPGQGWRG